MKFGELIDARLRRKMATNSAAASYDTPGSGRMDSKLTQRCLRSVAATRGIEWLELHSFEKQCNADGGAVAIKHVSELEAFPTR